MHAHQPLSIHGIEGALIKHVRMFRCVCLRVGERDPDLLATTLEDHAVGWLIQELRRELGGARMDCASQRRRRSVRGRPVSRQPSVKAVR
jgi:hypothetical protein